MLIKLKILIGLMFSNLKQRNIFYLGQNLRLIHTERKFFEVCHLFSDFVCSLIFLLLLPLSLGANRPLLPLVVPTLNSPTMHFLTYSRADNYDIEFTHR